MLRKEKLKVTIVLNVKFFCESINTVERLQKCREFTDICNTVGDRYC